MSESKAPGSKKSKSILSVILAAVVAGCAWFADQKGWLNSSKAEANSGGGTATIEQPANQGTAKPAAKTPAPSKPAAKPVAKPEAKKPDPTKPSQAEIGAAEIAAAFRSRRSDVQVQASGRIFKNLRDDLEGSRHQKFLVELADGATLLISHNIDLAPRVPAQEGDYLSFCGEYEFTDKGGVVHWTHHAPRGRHPDGWIEHKGKRYQ